MDITNFNKAQKIYKDLETLKTAKEIFSSSERVVGLSYIYRTTINKYDVALPDDTLEKIKTLIISEINRLENEFKQI